MAIHWRAVKNSLRGTVPDPYAGIGLYSRCRRYITLIYCGWLTSHYQYLDAVQVRETSVRDETSKGRITQGICRPRDASSKGQNIRDFSFSDTSVLDPSSWLQLVAESFLKCRFITPDGYNLHVIQGRLTIFDKPENDELRPDTWKYQWYGWNDTNR